MGTIPGGVSAPHSNAAEAENLLRDYAERQAFYEGRRVRVITVLAGSRRRIAIVEDENGEQFDVDAAALH